MVPITCLPTRADAEYVASTIATWSSRYVTAADAIGRQDNPLSKGHVLIAEKNHQFTRTVLSDSHVWLADEPTSVGGSDLGPDPYEHLLAALGACTSMTIRMYANRKQIPLEDVTVELNHSRQHAKDCEECDVKDSQIEVLSRYVTLKGTLTEQQQQRLLEIADRCPVHRTLHSELEVKTILKE